MFKFEIAQPPFLTYNFCMRKTCLLVLLFPVITCAEIDFAHQVLPILKQHCAECHTDGTYKGSFSMDTRDAMLGSKEGKAAVADIHYRVTTDDEDNQMPPKGDRLSKAQADMLKAWVDAGLPWSEGFSFRSKTYQAPLKPRTPDLPPLAKGADPDTNPVDRFIDAYFTERSITPPAAISDAAFVRRASLDLLGLLPDPAELAPADRVAHIDELLARDIDYATHWMAFWNDLLRNDYAGTGFIDGGRKQVTGWLFTSLAQNKPYDQFVRELIDPKQSTSGDSEGFIKGIKWRGNVNASQVQEVQFAQNTAQVFLGENIKCASCHDSFINDWKLSDAYGMAAIVSEKPLEMFRCDKPTGEQQGAKFLWPELGTIDPTASKAVKLKRTAELFTHPDNGRLARTIVNRLWQRLMGRGLVEPVDIMGNEPWHEDLLDWLASDLAAHDFDLKHTLRRIATSRAYQSVCAASPDGEANEAYQYTGPIARRMSAEQFMDAVWQLTGSGPKQIHAGVSVPAETGAAAAPDTTVSKAAGSWIWSTAKGALGAAAGEQIMFRRVLERKQAGTAVIVLTCDNSYDLRVNGKKIASDAAWEEVETYQIQLKAGRNAVNIIARNAGNSPNPAGLYANLKLDGKWNSTDWEWRDGETWRKAESLTANIWKIDAKLAAAEAHKPSTAGNNRLRPRAALVRSDPLQRSLGRPNREQVVTTRPANLSTLQALDLSNGAILDGLIKKGAPALSAAEQPFEHLCRRAFSRAPTASEAAVAAQVLQSAGDGDAAASAFEDLLWMVIMHPEFQTIR